MHYLRDITLQIYLHSPFSRIRVILLIPPAPPMLAVGEDLVGLLDFHEALLGGPTVHLVLHLVWVALAGQPAPGGRDLLLSGVRTEPEDLGIQRNPNYNIENK